MAGIAILPSLKTNGLEAIAMACAAFCIPTSMTMVRRATSMKSDGLSVSPKSNINSVSIGNTIKILFIPFLSLSAFFFR